MYGLPGVLVGEGLTVQALFYEELYLLVQVGNVEVASKPPEEAILPGVGSHVGQPNGLLMQD